MEQLTNMEARVAYILMKSGIEPGEVDACIYWAFGSDAWYLAPYPNWVDRWRTLHPEYPIKTSDSFVKWIFAVGIAYQKYMSDMIKQSMKN